jgi:hypothetical protein
VRTGRPSARHQNSHISAEAFSTFGVRKGNLISCRARLELKAQKRTGDIIAVERQTRCRRGPWGTGCGQDGTAKRGGGIGGTIVAKAGKVAQELRALVVAISACDFG